jgi:hypothetical protein
MSPFYLFRDLSVGLTVWSSGNDDKNLPFPAPGEPLETHEHGNITLHQWMVRNVPGYSQDRSQLPLN